MDLHAPAHADARGDPRTRMRRLGAGVRVPDSSEDRDDDDRGTYWSQTRQPLPNLIFILPLLAAYEVGIAWLGANAARTGVDDWVRDALRTAGVKEYGQFLLPVAVVGVLLGWLIVSGSRAWRFRPRWLLAMAAESTALGFAMIGLSRLVDRGFFWLEHHPILLAASPAGPDYGLDTALRPLVGFLGAGLYEEALFRLALLPVLYWGLKIVQAPELMAGMLAVTGSALAFSIAHHVGALGEVFSLYTFVFRWLAGVAFAWIFIVRGFGIAVGTHIAYDVLVGYAGWGG